MKIPFVTRILKDNLGTKDLPPWMDNFLYFLNQSLTTMGLALQGRLTLGDNFNCLITKQTFTHNVELTITPGQGQTVIGAIPLMAVQSPSALVGGTDTNASTQNVITGYRSALKSNGSLGLTVNLAGGGSYQALVTVWVIYG